MKQWSALLLSIGACSGTPLRPAVVQRATVLGADAPARVELPSAPAAATTPATFPSAPATVHAADDSAQSLQARTHEVLVRHCAECHAGHRATALAPALAIFDLDRSDWSERFDAARFEVALSRLDGKPEADQALFRAFRDAQLTRR